MDPDASGGWRFAQCFGDKGEVEDITEGTIFYAARRCRITPHLVPRLARRSYAYQALILLNLTPSRHHLHRRIRLDR